MLERKIGDAQLPEERSLEMSLAKVDDWKELTLTYRKVNAGFTNFNYLVHVKEKNCSYFAKVVGPNTETFIDRMVAHEAAVLAADCGVAPQIVQYVKEDDFEVYEFLEGFNDCTITDMLDPQVAAKVMDAYAKIHNRPPLSATKTGFEQVTEHLEQIKQVDADLPSDIDYLLWQMDRAKKAIEAAGIEYCPCFNDCYVSNYMINDQKDLRIIDWEYGANNDRYWDLASYFFECFADASTRHNFLMQYDKNAIAQDEARINLYLPLVCLKWGLWASLQASISSIPYDYLKYADILLLRARHAMRQETWERALAAV